MIEKRLRTDDYQPLLRARESYVGAVEIENEARRRANRVRIALGARHDDGGTLPTLQALYRVDDARGRGIRRESPAQKSALRAMGRYDRYGIRQMMIPGD